MPGLEIIVLTNTLCEKGERYETNHKIKRSNAAVSELADFFDNPFDLHEFKYTDGR